MGFFRWFYQNIFRREYPLISIPTFPYSIVPYSSFSPDIISLIFSESAKRGWGITDDDIPNITEPILEHEYLHIVIRQLVGFKANYKLNNIHRFSLDTKDSIWMFRDGKTFGHLCRQPI